MPSDESMPALERVIAQASSGWLLDGYPQTLSQVLDMLDDAHTRPHIVIEIILSDEAASLPLRHRALFHSTPGIPCDLFTMPGPHSTSPWQPASITIASPECCVVICDTALTENMDSRNFGDDGTGVEEIQMPQSDEEVRILMEQRLTVYRQWRDKIVAAFRAEKVPVCAVMAENHSVEDVASSVFTALGRRCDAHTKRVVFLGPPGAGKRSVLEEIRNMSTCEYCLESRSHSCLF